jgi:NhaA family Na+:H+ antiporter
LDQPHAQRSNSAPPISRRLLKPLERFFQVEASSGVVLFVATLAAMLWANSRWHVSYESLWHLTIELPLGAHHAAVSPRFLVNDGLMTIFFLLVGLEIRRELHHGVLASVRAAMAPIAAALGGMLVPALIFLTVAGSGIRQGWAIPTATDIAFAIGALTLLAQRVPPPARVLLLALAVIDDIGAVLIIGFFYSSGIDALGLWIAAGGVLGVLAFQRFSVRSALAYVLPGSIIWMGLHHAGLHPTLAGAILGLLTPARVPLPRGAKRELRSPVERLQVALHPWVAYGIMPLFALANAGVALEGVTYSTHDTGALIAAIVLALVLGKPLGIVLFTWLAAKSGLSTLAPGLNGRGVLLIGCFGGIGFTMSLFLATLAFADSRLLATAKVAILLASAIAGLGGFVLGRVVLFPNRAEIGGRTSSGS